MCDPRQRENEIEDYVWVDGKLEHVFEPEQMSYSEYLSNKVDTVEWAYLQTLELQKKVKFFECQLCHQKGAIKYPLCYKCRDYFNINNITDMYHYYERTHQTNLEFFHKYTKIFEKTRPKGNILYFWFSYIAKIENIKRTHWILANYNSKHPIRELIIPKN